MIELTFIINIFKNLKKNENTMRGHIETVQRQKQMETREREKYSIWKTNLLGEVSWSEPDGINTFHSVFPLIGTTIPEEQSGDSEKQMVGRWRHKARIWSTTKLVVGCPLTFPSLWPSLDSKAPRNLEWHNGYRQKEPKRKIKNQKERIQEKPSLFGLRSKEGSS